MRVWAGIDVSLLVFIAGESCFNIGPELGQQVAQPRGGETGERAVCHLSAVDALRGIVGVGKGNAQFHTHDARKIKALFPGIPPGDDDAGYRVLYAMAYRAAATLAK